MKIYKARLNESKSELETYRKKSREMEAFVSVIQRAWSQVIRSANALAVFV